MLENAKFSFLFDKLQHAGLQANIEALKASINTRTAVSYTTVSNHLSTGFPHLPEYSAQNRIISIVDARGTSDGIHDPYGSIISDKCIPNWSDLSNKDRNWVTDETKRLGIGLGKGGKGEKGGNSGENNNNKNKSIKKK